MANSVFPQFMAAVDRNDLPKAKELVNAAKRDADTISVEDELNTRGNQLLSLITQNRVLVFRSIDMRRLHLGVVAPMEIPLQETKENEGGVRDRCSDSLNGSDGIESCPIARAAKRYKFNEETHKHLKKYDHGQLPDCRYGETCRNLLRVLNGSSSAQQRLGDLCHVELYRHPIINEPAPTSTALMGALMSKNAEMARFLIPHMSAHEIEVIDPLQQWSVMMPPESTTAFDMPGAEINETERKTKKLDLVDLIKLFGAHDGSGEIAVARLEQVVFADLPCAVENVFAQWDGKGDFDGDFYDLLEVALRENKNGVAKELIPHVRLPELDEPVALVDRQEDNRRLWDLFGGKRRKYQGQFNHIVDHRMHAALTIFLRNKPDAAKSPQHWDSVQVTGDVRLMNAFLEQRPDCWGPLELPPDLLREAVRWRCVTLVKKCAASNMRIPQSLLVEHQFYEGMEILVKNGTRQWDDFAREINRQFGERLALYVVHGGWTGMKDLVDWGERLFDGRNGLEIACRMNRVALVKSVLEDMAWNPAVVSHCVDLASKIGNNFRMLKMLVERLDDLSLCKTHMEDWSDSVARQSFIEQAIKDDKVAFIKHLFTLKPNFHESSRERDAKRNDLCHMAAKHDSIKVLKFLVQTMDPCRRNNDQATSLHVAAASGSGRAVVELCQLCDPNDVDGNNKNSIKLRKEFLWRKHRFQPPEEIKTTLHQDRILRRLHESRGQGQWVPNSPELRRMNRKLAEFERDLRRASNEPTEEDEMKMNSFAVFEQKADELMEFLRSYQSSNGQSMFDEDGEIAEVLAKKKREMENWLSEKNRRHRPPTRRINSLLQQNEEKILRVLADIRRLLLEDVRQCLDDRSFFRSVRRFRREGEAHQRFESMGQMYQAVLLMIQMDSHTYGPDVHQPTFAALVDQLNELVRREKPLIEEYKRQEGIENLQQPPTLSLPRLFVKSLHTQELLAEVMQDLARLTGGDSHRGKVKSMFRTIQKQTYGKPNKDGSPRDVWDLCRAMIRYLDLQGIVRGFEALRDRNTFPQIRIVNVWNRFTAKPEPAWADLMLHVVFPGEDAVPQDRLICEVQLVLKKMFVAREELDGHQAYESYRLAMELERHIKCQERRET